MNSLNTQRLGYTLMYSEVFQPRRRYNYEYRKQWNTTAFNCRTLYYTEVKGKKKKKVKFSMKEYIELLWNLFSEVYIGIYFNSICWVTRFYLFHCVFNLVQGILETSYTKHLDNFAFQFIVQTYLICDSDIEVTSYIKIRQKKN